ncbi:MAG: phospholipid/glycerol acyltransferase [Alphaproteobacteria bacterium]|jgi:1-acyl-sn-glycerol-3-phosphate acyltransferase|nr:phospholipid/glycerol acyltransferase [Alphaproteobacteria bacterium]
MRSLAFNLFFYAFTVVFALFLIPLTAIPGRRVMAWGLRFWGRRVVWAMRAIGGMTVEVRGRERIPARGPSLIASKHQSEADGMVMAAEVPDIAFVAMRELWAYPLVGTILRKLEMIRVDTCGGGKERENLATFARRAYEAQRNIAIYPEGHLMPVGEKERYRSGIYYLYRDLNLPVIPVAHCLGLLWPERSWNKKRGRAILEFLPPIETGLEREAFMQRLEDTIEDCTALLVSELSGQPPVKARFRIKFPDQHPPVEAEPTVPRAAP